MNNVGWLAMGRIGLMVWLLNLPMLAARAESIDIDVVGLFKNAAMLIINGDQQLLKTGQRSPEGVSLVSADSRSATIELNGETMTLDLSSKISTKFAAHVPATVAIQRHNEQYLTTGVINGVPVTFVIDTGATLLAMNSAHAAALGLDMSRARPMRAYTASGSVAALQLVLDQVEVGEIQVSNVLAAVLPGDNPANLLLGMSFLRHVEMSEKAGLMLLKGR